MDIMSLPIVMIENIFSFLSFDEIAKYRIVSRGFNEICMRLLNRGFIMIERRHALALKNVKAQLPRRESERRYHQLSRHCDILTSIETRISMLNMTYCKFIDHGLCCFIPGRVIDEIRRVLTIVETESTPPRAHEVLQELRDISSMAIEHFDDKISPAFRRRIQDSNNHAAPRMPQTAILAPLGIRHEVKHLRRRALLNARLSLYLSSQYKRISEQIAQYRKLAMRQQAKIRYMAKRQRIQNATIADLKKRIEECDIKYSELTHTNQAAGGKVIAASKASDVTSTQELRHFSSQIKLDLSDLPIGTSRGTSNKKSQPNIRPRKPVIKLPSLSEADGEPPTKIAKLSPGETPSTSSSPKTKPQSAMAKIRGLANEIRYLSSLAKNYEENGKNNLKRPTVSPDEISECKKLKKE